MWLQGLSWFLISAPERRSCTKGISDVADRIWRRMAPEGPCDERNLRKHSDFRYLARLIFVEIEEHLT